MDDPWQERERDADQRGNANSSAHNDGAEKSSGTRTLRICRAFRFCSPAVSRFETRELDSIAVCVLEFIGKDFVSWPDRNLQNAVSMRSE